MIRRLVEADVAVVADAEQLQVHAAERFDERFIAGGFRLEVLRKAVRHMRVRLVDVDVVEQVVVHEIAVAVRVVAGKPAVFVEVDRPHAGEVEEPLFAALDQFFVCADGRRARRKAEHAVGLQVHLRADHARGKRAHLLVGFDPHHAHRRHFQYQSFHFAARFPGRPPLPTL